MNSEIHLAEVGFPRFHAPVSMTGIEFERHEELTIPRLVVFEPGGDYQVHHRAYTERIKAIGADIYSGDIYKPDTLEALPPIGLLVIENVLSDPDYENKDIEGLIKLLSIKIVVGGLVLVIDTLIEGGLSILLSLLKEADQVNLEIVMESLRTKSKENKPNDEWVNFIMRTLDQLNLVDKALEKGLSTINLNNDNCLLLQRK